jgi:hypothetical protein
MLCVLQWNMTEHMQPASLLYLFIYLNHLLFNYKCLSTSLREGMRISKKFERTRKKVVANLIVGTIL